MTTPGSGWLAGLLLAFLAAGPVAAQEPATQSGDRTLVMPLENVNHEARIYWLSE